MSFVTLKRRPGSSASIDASLLDCGGFSHLDEREIAMLEVRANGEAVAIGDVFEVVGGRASDVRIEGDLAGVDGLGARMASGTLLIAGDAGNGVGAGMTGGRVHVLGRVGNDAGLAMRGGEILIDGGAGDRLGAAEPGARRGMSGGEILVSGSVGEEAGMRLRRGLIVIGGSTGGDLARDMIAGTVVVFGRSGPRPAVGNKRGSLVALGGIDVPATYRPSCVYEPPFVRLLMTYLARRHGAPIGNALLSGRYRRYCGDAGVPGKGEILEWLRT